MHNNNCNTFLQHERGREGCKVLGGKVWKDAPYLELKYSVNGGEVAVV